MASYWESHHRPQRIKREAKGELLLQGTKQLDLPHLRPPRGKQHTSYVFTPRQHMTCITNDLPTRQHITCITNDLPTRQHMTCINAPFSLRNTKQTPQTKNQSLYHDASPGITRRPPGQSLYSDASHHPTNVSGAV